MKLNIGFGVYEDEIEPILAGVRCQRPLAEIEAMTCPCCGARISVRFSAQRRHEFQVFCARRAIAPVHIPGDCRASGLVAGANRGYGAHHDLLAQHQLFCERWPAGNARLGRNADGCLWSGRMILRPDQADYPLWCWIVSQGDR